MGMNKQVSTNHYDDYVNDWNRLAFIECAEQILDFRGKTPKKLGMEWGNGTVPALSANNVKMGKVDFEAETYFGSVELYNKWMTKGELNKGDVLMTMEAPLGNIAQVPSNGKYILSQRVIAIKTKPFIYNTFFMYYLMSPQFQRLLETHSTGTTAKGISQKNLNNLDVFVPPLSEQRKIADILMSVDDAIEATQRIIDQTQVVKRGLMQELLTKGIGHTSFKETEIGEIPTEWDLKTIGHVLVDCQYGLSESLSTEPIGIPVLRMNNIQSGTVIIGDLKYLNVEESSIQKYLLNMDDILFNRTNSQDLVGKTAIFKHDGKFTFASYLIRIRGNKEIVDQNFLNYYMNSDEGQARIRAYMSIGVSQSNINATNLKKVYLPLPPMKEQQAIVETLSSVDAKIETETNTLGGLKVIKQGLMQVLLTGKVRVNFDAPSEVSV